MVVLARSGHSSLYECLMLDPLGVVTPRDAGRVWSMSPKVKSVIPPTLRFTTEDDLLCPTK